VHDENICYAPDAPEFNPIHLSYLMATTLYGLLTYRLLQQDSKIIDIEKQND